MSMAPKLGYGASRRGATGPGGRLPFIGASVQQAAPCAVWTPASSLNARAVALGLFVTIERVILLRLLEESQEGASCPLQPYS